MEGSMLPAKFMHESYHCYSEARSLSAPTVPIPDTPIRKVDDNETLQHPLSKLRAAKPA